MIEIEIETGTEVTEIPDLKTVNAERYASFASIKFKISITKTL